VSFDLNSPVESVETKIQRDGETNREFDERIAAIRSTGKRVIPVYVVDGRLPPPLDWQPLGTALFSSVLARTGSPVVAGIVEANCREIFARAMPAQLVDPDLPKSSEAQLVDVLHSTVGHLMGEIAKLTEELETCRALH
jgi:hypothetical protein